MRLSVASGKGGTGKTTVAVGIALSVEGITLADCDVEAPNCHLFFRNREPTVAPVNVTISVPDLNLCTFCGLCVAACHFNALAIAGRQFLLFPSLCKGCGTCQIACPVDALHDTERPVGQIETNCIDDKTLVTGRLYPGESKTTSVIDAVKQQVAGRSSVILDCAPGAACPMVEGVKGTHLCLLVTEPTPFGLHDLSQALKTTRRIGVPAAVVVNRSEGSDQSIESFCRTEKIPILGRIPFDFRAALAHSRGIHPLEALPEWKSLFRGIWERAKELVESREPAGIAR